MTVIIFVAIVSFLKGVTATLESLEYEEANWIDYINGQVELDDYDKDKARTAKDDTDQVLKEVTAHYSQPIVFRIEDPGKAPFTSLIFNGAQVKTKAGTETWSPEFYKGNVCGGAVLTHNVVMTVCACVHTFLWTHDKITNEKSSLKSGIPDKSSPYDLGVSPLYVLPFGEQYEVDEGTERPQRGTYYYKFKIDFRKDWPGYRQYRNARCLKIMSNMQRDNPANYKFRLNELQSTLAILKYTPDFDGIVPDWFVPWPPIVIPYDSKLRGRSKYFDSLSSGRNRQSLSVSSYGFNQLANDSAYRTTDGRLVDVYHSLMTFRTTLCNQQVCRNVEDHLKNIDADHLMDPSSLGCFCDSNARNNLCGGLIGSPAIYDGLLYGLMVEPLPCHRLSPRGLLVRGFDTETVNIFSNSVPELSWRESAHEEQFRINGSLVVDYNVVFPAPGLLPDIDKNLQISADEVGRFFSPHKGSSPTTSIPFLLTVVFPSIELLLVI